MNLTFFSFPRRGPEETQAGQTPRAAGGCAGCEGRGRGKPATFTAASNTLSPPVISLCWIFILFQRRKKSDLHFSTPHISPTSHPQRLSGAESSMSRKSQAGLRHKAGLTVGFSGNSSLRSKRAFPRTPGPAPACTCLCVARGVRPPKAHGSFTSPRSLDLLLTDSL